MIFHEKITISRETENETSTVHTISDISLRTADTAKNVGILKDRKMTLVPHIITLVHEAKQTMGFYYARFKNF